MTRELRSTTWCRPAAVASVATVGALHAWWATGSPWPMGSRDAFADAVTGNGRFPSPAACLTVASLLAAAAGVLDGRPRHWPWLHQAGVRGVTVIMAVRGVAGITGTTHHLVPGADSARFRSLDQSLYGPICLVLATLCVGVAREGAATVTAVPRSESPSAVRHRA